VYQQEMFPAPLIEVAFDCMITQGLFLRIDRAGHSLIEDFLPQVGQYDQMMVSQLPCCGEKILVILVAGIRNQDYERTPVL
jgi:hypothetical protein